MDVGLRIVGETDRAGPLVAVEPGGVEVPIRAVCLGVGVIHFLRPYEPGLALRVHGYLRRPDIAGYARYWKRHVPRAGRIAARVNLFAQAAVGRPHGPEVAVRTRGRRGEIVLPRRVSKRRHAAEPGHAATPGSVERRARRVRRIIGNA